MIFKRTGEDALKVMERGQITIPKKYRERYGITPDTEITLVPTEEGLLIVKSGTARTPFRDVFGILCKKGSSDAVVREMRGSDHP